MTSRMAEDAAPRHAYQMRGMRLMTSSTAVRGTRKVAQLVGVLLDVELSQKLRCKPSSPAAVDWQADELGKHKKIVRQKIDF
jgi:hypothetical protein